MRDFVMRPATSDDRSRFQEIREAAFAPVFASFRSIMGDQLYRLAQEREDGAQGALLDTLMQLGSGGQVFAAEVSTETAGFVSIHANAETQIGEIGA